MIRVLTMVYHLTCLATLFFMETSIASLDVTDTDLTLSHTQEHQSHATTHIVHENNLHATARSVVRGEWNFSGYILSDAGAAAFVGKTQIGHPGDPWHESNKSFGHGFASSPSDAAIKVRAE